MFNFMLLQYEALQSIRVVFSFFN